MTMMNLKKIKITDWKNIPIPLIEAFEVVIKELMSISVATNNNSGHIRQINRKMAENLTSSVVKFA